MPTEWSREGFLISMDTSRLDRALIAEFLRGS